MTSIETFRTGRVPTCPGVASAEVLLRAGVPQSVVVPALCREVGLTVEEAERAWDGALARIDAAYPYRSSCITLAVG